MMASADVAKEVQDRLHEKHALKVKLEFDPALANLKAEEKLAREAPALALAATPTHRA